MICLVYKMKRFKIASKTLRDVAQESGVSIGTMSNYLKDPNSVKPANRIRIEQAIRLLKYTPNINAQILATGVSHNIVLYLLSEKLISPTTWLHQLPAIQAVHDQLCVAGYNLQMRIVYAADPKGFFENIRKCVESKVADGVMILSVWEVPAQVITYLQESSYPFVVMDSIVADSSVNTVYFDNYGMMKELVKRLVAYNHRNIGYIHVKSCQQDMQQRFMGYLDGLKECGLDIEEKNIMYGDFSIESGYACISQAIRNRSLNFTSVLCGNDNMGVGAIKALFDHHYAIPRDVSLIGVDDSIAAHACTPRLETVRFDLAALGKRAVDMLLKRLSSKGEVGAIKLGYRIVEGETVAKAPI